MCSFVYTRRDLVPFVFALSTFWNKATIYGRQRFVLRFGIKLFGWLKQMTITLALSSFSLKDFRVYMESVRTFQFAKELTYKTLLFWFAYNFCRFNEVVVLLCHKHINSFNTLWRICIDATQVYTNIWCAWHLFLRIFLTIISNEMLSSLWILWMHWSTLKNIDFVELTILQMWASFNLFIKQIHVVFESSLQSYRTVLASKYILYTI